MEPCAADSQPVVAEVVEATPLAVSPAAALARPEPEAFDKLRALEDEIHRRALVCLHDVSLWTDVEPDTKDRPGTQEPPQAWIDELGLEAARKRLRVAKSAWMSAKEAPIGIKVAKEVAVGIARARATEKGGGTTLSVQQVVFNAPRYEVLEVSSDDG